MGDMVPANSIDDKELGDGDGSKDTNNISPTTTTPNNKADKLFDPSVDMLVNDFDDERTLEEEEALAAGEAEDPNAELSSLQKESNMPLEELLALYGYRGENQENESPVEDDQEQSETGMEEQESEPDPPINPSKLRALYEPIPDSDQDASRLLRCKSAISRISEEEEEDYDYSPDEDEWRKTIMVGADYQAYIPEGLCHYDDALPYENEDKLLWDPARLAGETVEEYLKSAGTAGTVTSGSAGGVSSTSLPMGSQLRDDEQALFLLQQCGHSAEEALRRIRVSSAAQAQAAAIVQSSSNGLPVHTTPHAQLAPAPTAPVAPGILATATGDGCIVTATTAAATAASAASMSLWSEDECRNFEGGVRCYGKNFYLIQQNKVRTRSVGELVQFYYLWKKSERHDIFANKSRLEKKKYTLHPGLTDFMDRFLEEQDGAQGQGAAQGGGNSRDRSSSPNIQTCNAIQNYHHHHHRDEHRLMNDGTSSHTRESRGSIRSSILYEREHNSSSMLSSSIHSPSSPSSPLNTSNNNHHHSHSHHHYLHHNHQQQHQQQQAHAQPASPNANGNGKDADASNARTTQQYNNSL